MKLRNKKTGEIRELPDGFFCGDNLKKICEEWEDYKEPKEYWFIDTSEGAVVEQTEEMFELTDKERKQIGNYFETREEAEEAVEKLKAWKRLKDAGVSFKPTTIGHKWYLEPHASPENRTFKESQDLYKDVILFFGGKNEISS